MITCPNCGQQVQDGMQQCPYCGAPLTQQVSQQNPVPNQQFTQNINIPQQAPKKKHGCLIALLIVAGLGMLGIISGGGKAKKDSGKVEIEPNQQTSESSKQSDPVQTEQSEAQTDTAADNEKFSYELKNTIFNYYTNSIGNIEYYGIVEILNTGSTNLYMDDCTFDLEDNDGHLLQSDSFISTCPDIIAPGETGYFYNGLGANQIDSSVSFDNGVKLVPNYKVEQSTAEIVDYTVSDTDMRTDDYGNIKITGRVTNETDTDDSLVSIQFVLLDSDNNVLAITGTSVMDLTAGSTQSFEGTTMFADDTATPEKVASYNVIARKAHYQF